MMRYLLFLVLTLPGVLYAGGSHERARELVEQGAIMPLEQLIAQVQQDNVSSTRSNGWIRRAVCIKFITTPITAR